MVDTPVSRASGVRAVVLLAAGNGTRIQSQIPKSCLPLAGKPIAAWTSSALLGATDATKLYLVVSSDSLQADQVMEAVSSVEPSVEIIPVVQESARGTGDAAAVAVEAFAKGESNKDAEILISVGDAALLRSETIARLITARRETKSESAWLGFVPRNPRGYGRMIFADGARTKLQAIVEEKDLAQKASGQSSGEVSDAVWSGVMVATLGSLAQHLPKLEDKNAQGEKLLTDLAALIDSEGKSSTVVFCDEEEALGVNTRADLAQAEGIVQQRLRSAALEAGAGLISPDNVWLAHDTRLAADCLIDPWVWFGVGVSIASGAQVRSFSHLEGVTVETGAVVGPFARVRPQTTLGQGVRVGNFVEIKASELHEGVRASHLSYIGDAQIGAESNIGAGSITCNYDGINKHRTALGKRVFIGSNSALVAPVAIGDGSIVGAGSVVRHNVSSDSVVVSHAKERLLWEPASRWRARKSGKISETPLFAGTEEKSEEKGEEKGTEKGKVFGAGNSAGNTARKNTGKNEGTS